MPQYCSSVAAFMKYCSKERESHTPLLLVSLFCYFIQAYMSASWPSSELTVSTCTGTSRKVLHVEIIRLYCPGTNSCSLLSAPRVPTSSAWRNSKPFTLTRQKVGHQNTIGMRQSMDLPQKQEEAEKQAKQQKLGSGDRLKTTKRLHVHVI